MAFFADQSQNFSNGSQIPWQLVKVSGCDIWLQHWPLPNHLNNTFGEVLFGWCQHNIVWISPFIASFGVSEFSQTHEFDIKLWTKIKQKQAAVNDDDELQKPTLAKQSYMRTSDPFVLLLVQYFVVWLFSAPIIGLVLDSGEQKGTQSFLVQQFFSFFPATNS